MKVVKIAKIAKITTKYFAGNIVRGNGVLIELAAGQPTPLAMTGAALHGTSMAATMTWVTSPSLPTFRNAFVLGVAHAGYLGVSYAQNPKRVRALYCKYVQSEFKAIIKSINEWTR